MSSYSDEAAFDASMLVHFRERISVELVNKVNQEMVKNMLEAASSELTEKKSEDTEEVEEAEKEGNTPRNRGKLILDATCAPGDIAYPTDLELLNQARKHTEKIIDLLYGQLKGQLEKKPRTPTRSSKKRLFRSSEETSCISKI